MRFLTTSLKQMKIRVNQRVKKGLLLTCLVLTCMFQSSLVMAQEEDEGLAGNGLYIGVFYGINWPGGDLADRFGNNFSVGGNFEYFYKQKWVFGFEGQFLFGNEVKENVAGELVDVQGRLINTAPSIASIDVKERGIHFMGKIGRMHDLWSDEHVSGIKWTLGFGYLQHKIRLADSQEAVPFFEGDYIAGYDRLTGGFALTQFAGYQYLNRQGRLNAYVGVEVTEAFTKSQRGLSYNTKIVDDASRFDLLFGLKAGINITIKGYRDKDDIWY